MIGSKREDVVGEGIPPEVEWVLTFECSSIMVAEIYRVRMARFT